MASTPQPVSIPVSLTVIGIIWAADFLERQPGNAAVQTREVTEQADTRTSATDVKSTPSKLKSAVPSPVNSPK
jgi:hypothetical protein